jgi:E1A/CREB-binding protein
MAAASTSMENMVGTVSTDGSYIKNYARHHVEKVRSLASRDIWTMEMWSILKLLIDDEKHNRQIFNEPVDDRIVLGYYTVITNPMDLGTIRCRLEDGYYATIHDFKKDVLLVFENAKIYNKPDHFVHKAAVDLRSMFLSKFNEAEKKLAQQKAEQDKHACNICDQGKRSCCICDQKCLLFAYPEYRCSPPCKMRIPRNQVYYRIGGERGQHWCQRCYSNLRDEFVGILGQVLIKKDLEKCVNDDAFLENWVKCVKCSKFAHHICTLYLDPHYANDKGPRQVGSLNCKSKSADASSSPSSPFVCFNCLAHDKPSSNTTPRLLPALVETLPHCEMSEFLQTRIQECCVSELTTPSLNPGHALLNPQLSLEEATKISKTLKIRVVSHILNEGQMEARARKWVETQSEIARRASLTKLTHHSKTICLFQESEFESILNFALYVQEYGQECPQNSSNYGNVYVSYLDSAPYITPHRLRTVLYKELMFSYFLWVRARGFNSAYIWACPPQKGDAYVMNCHPKWQRNPSNERLRKWYNSIFKRCEQEGIVVSFFLFTKKGINRGCFPSAVFKCAFVDPNLVPRVSRFTYSIFPANSKSMKLLNHPLDSIFTPVHCALYHKCLVMVELLM